MNCPNLIRVYITDRYRGFERAVAVTGRPSLMRPDVRTKFERATGLPSLRSESCGISSDFSMTEDVARSKDRGVSVVEASFVSPLAFCVCRAPKKIVSNIFSSQTVKKKETEDPLFFDLDGV